MVTVVNLRRRPYTLYIGRAGCGEPGTFGNPFIVGVHGERGECVRLYDAWLNGRLRTITLPPGCPECVLRDIDGVSLRALIRAQVPPDAVLGCFCKPLACHGDSIAAFVNAGYPEP